MTPSATVQGDDGDPGTGPRATTATDERLDFVGHIGGDLFVVFRSADWEILRLATDP